MVRLPTATGKHLQQVAPARQQQQQQKQAPRAPKAPKAPREARAAVSTQDLDAELAAYGLLQ